uniref:hypothetical protein n=1 Tax=Klebsiella pneumoniae TaxID=573 RepID=UPI003EB86805
SKREDVKFPVKSVSTGQSENVHCGRGRKLNVTEEEGIAVWKVMSSGYMKKLGLGGIEHNKIGSAPIRNQGKIRSQALHGVSS